MSGFSFRKTDPGGRPLGQDFSTEAVMLGRTTAGSRLPRTGRLHEPTAIDQTPKILFVQANSSQGLYSLLQLQ